MKCQYIRKKFEKETLLVIQQAEDIINEYTSAGYRLTLRQLYYQFVARDYLPNCKKSYDRLGAIINNARLAGLIDWSAIEDRTRNVINVNSWDSPYDIMASVVCSYKIDLWRDQSYRPEVWIEKDALLGVIETICNELRVPCFSCRGYVSQSEMWSAGQRFADHYLKDQIPVILHLGDHDPSGIDMSRDIQERMTMFVSHHIEDVDEIRVERLALNIEQIRKYNPPPNMAKLTDSRIESYLSKYGRKSWELDALGPDILCKLIEDAVSKFKDEKRWAISLDEEQRDIEALKNSRENFREGD